MKNPFDVFDDQPAAAAPAAKPRAAAPVAAADPNPFDMFDDSPMLGPSRFIPQPARAPHLDMIEEGSAGVRPYENVYPPLRADLTDKAAFADVNAPAPAVPLPIMDALRQSLGSGTIDTVAGGARGILEALSAPFDALKGTPLAALTEAPSAIYDPMKAETQIATDLSGVLDAEAAVGAVRPEDLEGLLANPEGAARYFGNIGAKSLPSILAAMATRDPKLATRMIMATTGASTYGQEREQGADPHEAIVQAFAAAVAEGGLSTLPFEEALGAGRLGRRMLTVPAAEAGTEAVTGGGQYGLGQALAGEDVDSSQLKRAVVDSAVVGGPMGIVEALAGNGPAPTTDPAVADPGAIVNPRDIVKMLTETPAVPAPSAPVAETAFMSGTEPAPPAPVAAPARSSAEIGTVIDTRLTELQNAASARLAPAEAKQLADDADELEALLASQRKLRASGALRSADNSLTDQELDEADARLVAARQRLEQHRTGMSAETQRTKLQKRLDRIDNDADLAALADEIAPRTPAAGFAASVENQRVQAENQEGSGQEGVQEGQGRGEGQAAGLSGEAQAEQQGSLTPDDIRAVAPDIVDEDMPAAVELAAAVERARDAGVTDLDLLDNETEAQYRARLEASRADATADEGNRRAGQAQGGRGQGQGQEAGAGALRGNEYPGQAPAQSGLTPRRPAPAAVPAGATRESLVAAVTAARSPAERSAAAAAVAAYDAENPGAPRSVRPGTESPLAAGVRQALGPAFKGVNVLARSSDLDPEIDRKYGINADAQGNVEGFYDPDTGEVYIFEDQLDTSRMPPQARAIWVAAHERVGHAGLRGSAVQEGGNAKAGAAVLAATLKRANQNPTIAAVAKAMESSRPERGPILIEEALSELAAAVQTGDYSEIEARYGITIPQAQRDTLVGFFARLIQNLRAIWGFGPEVADFDIYNIIKDANKFARENSPRGTSQRSERAPSSRADITQTPAFRRWFGDSKIVDENGEPLVVYHGSDAEFSVFEYGEEGFHFGTREQASQAGKNVSAFYLSAQNVFALDDDISNWNDLEYVADVLLEKKLITADERKTFPGLQEWLIKKGFDGYSYPNAYEGKGVSYAVLNPNQIKSATGNSGAFDPANPSIIASRRAVADKRFAGMSPEEVAAVGKFLKNLTPAEQLKVGKAAAAKIIAHLEKLPSAKEMASTAIAGQAKRGWYAQSAQTIADVFGVDGPRFALLLAATSPQTSVQSNLRNTLNIWANWTAAGRPQTREEIVEVMGRSVEGSRGADSVLDAWINNSVRALTGDPNTVVLSGPKVNSFFQNLVGDVNEVTNDAWMASYALVNQTIFKGGLNKDGTNPGKTPGYLAMNARVRETAAYLTKLTGETWTPAEVQETIWSWAKTVYEAADSAGEIRTAEELVSEGAITDAMIADTPDFGTLFTDPQYATILEEAGYDQQVQQLRARGDSRAEDGGRRQPAAAREGSPLGDATQRRLEARSARRLDALRRQRAEAGRVTEDDGEVPFSRGATINIGLDIPGGGKLKPQAVHAAVRATGVEITRSSIFVSDTEPTAVMDLDRPLTAEEGGALSAELQQEAIAQRYSDGTGDLFGPMAEKWGPYNPDFFMVHTGERASEFEKRVAESDKKSKAFYDKARDGSMPWLTRNVPPARMGAVLDDMAKDKKAMDAGRDDVDNGDGTSTLIASRGVPSFNAKPVQKDAKAVDAVHYGKVPGLKQLDPTKAGTAGAGRERTRFGVGNFGKQGGTAARLGFYVIEDGKVPAQEDIVREHGGIYPYRVRLTNLYDATEDSRGIVADSRGNPDTMEEEISDAGFDGFYMEAPGRGIDVPVAVVFDLGKKKIPVAPADENGIVASRRPMTSDEAYAAYRAAYETAEYKAKEEALAAARRAMYEREQELVKSRWDELAAQYAQVFKPEFNESQRKSLVWSMGNEFLVSDPEYVRLRDKANRLDTEITSFGPDYVRDNYPPISEFIDKANQERAYYESNNFKRWFAGSKAVNADGRPLVAFHGSPADITTFMLVGPKGAITRRKNPEYTGQLGIWFAAPADGTWYDDGTAEGMADIFTDDTGAIYPVHLSIKNPKEFDGWEDVQDTRESLGNSVVRMRKKLIAEGYDGVVVRGSDTDGAGHRDDWVAFYPNQVKSALGNNGDFDPANPSIVASRRTPAQARQQRTATLTNLGYPMGSPTQQGPGGRFLPLKEAADELRRRLQDKMLPVLRAQERVAPQNAPGVTSLALSDAENAYRMENLMYGRTRDRIEQADRDFVLKLQVQMKRLGVSIDQLQDYLLARHAPERNARIAAINAAKPDSGSGISNQEAADIMAGRAPGPYSGKPLSADTRRDAAIIARTVDAMRDRTLANLVESHQLQQGLVNALLQRYPNYVPLRGLESDPDAVTRGGSGRGITVKGKGIMRALGRSQGSYAQNILGEMVGDLQRSIVAAEKTKVAQAFLKFALANPQPDLYTVEPVDLEWKWSESTGEAYLGVRNLQEDADTTLVVMHDGNPVRIRFEDPDLAKALVNLDAPELGILLKTMSAINRWRSAVLTRFNPGFGPVNIARDFLFGMTAASAELGPKMAAEVLAGYLPAMRAMWRDARGRPGNAAGPRTWDNIAREFAEAGGKTGLTQVDDVVNLQRQMTHGSATLMQLAAQGKSIALARESIKRAGKPILDVIEDFNDATENAIRLSAYAAQRKAGKPIARAAEYAKNMTINFNRKGEFGPVLNAIYLFFNAAMQGSHAVLRLMRNPKVSAFLVGLGGLQAMMAASMMADDDDDGITAWDKVPDYVKRTSLVIPLGWKTGDPDDYFALPMPYGFNLFPYAGGRLMQHNKHGRRATDSNVIADVAKSTTEAFSPVPLTEGGNSLFGDQLGFMMGLYGNTDDFGQPIVNDRFAPEGTPKALLGRPDTPQAYHMVSRFMARVGGGDLSQRIAPVGPLDIAPEQIEAVVDYFAGGLGSIANQGTKWWEQTTAGNLEDAMDSIASTPIARRFISTGNENRAVADRYYGETGEFNRNKEVLEEGFRNVEPDQYQAVLDAAAAREPVLRGMELDKYKRKANKSERAEGREFAAGDIKRNPDGTPKLKPGEDSVFEEFKSAEKEVKSINQRIRALRAEGMTLQEVRDMVTSTPPWIDAPDVATLGLPETYDPKAMAPQRIRTRAIRMLQDQRGLVQKNFLTALGDERDE